MNITRYQPENAAHGRAVVALLREYARDIPGGSPLAEEVCRSLPERLATIPHARIFLAWEAGEAVGVCICFVGFSTFQARPLWNIHDIAVRGDQRGKGIGQALLAAVAEAARAEGCCKLTLEVRDDNPARRLYLREGFEAGESGSTATGFLTKMLD